MKKLRAVTEFITETELTLAKLKAVNQLFPDARVSRYMIFSSSSINKCYTKIEFERRYRGLFAIPYYEMKFENNGKEEIIKIHSKPYASRLAYFDRFRINGKRTMRFSRLHFNLKNNNFKDEMFNACRMHIIKYISDNPGIDLNYKHLDSRIKKLLIFI